MPEDKDISMEPIEPDDEIEIEFLDDELVGLGIGGIVEKLFPITDHDGIARAPGRCADTRNRATVRNRKQNDRGQSLDRIAVLGSQPPDPTVIVVAVRVAK